MSGYGGVRDSIALEDARVLEHTHFDGDQHVLRLAAPRCAREAQPGTFVHVRCAPALAMRRPFSIMRVDRSAGWIELLYKVVGRGTELLRSLEPGATLSVLGPIGHGFTLHAHRPRVLALGGGVGIPPMIFLAQQLRERAETAWQPLVLMGSEVPFPFRARPSTAMLAGVPAGTTACVPLLEDWRVPSRLASKAGFAGCFDGFVTELADHWLQHLDPAQRGEVELFACGPTPMLRATAALARRHQLPCQVALEEYMACGVGGCAGCVVPVRGPQGVAMQRVCVDGPVFDAAAVFEAA